MRRAVTFFNLRRWTLESPVPKLNYILEIWEISQILFAEKRRLDKIR